VGVRLLVVQALAFMVAAAGCVSGTDSGSGTGIGPQLTHDEYQARIESAPVVLETAALFYRLAAGDVSDVECRTGAARTFARNVHRIIDSVAALNPPDDAADLQRRLLAAAEETSSALDPLADDVEAGDVTCGQPWNERAYGLASTTRVEAVIAEYAAAGDQLGLHGR
jgi:hypothetical protein